MKCDGQKKENKNSSLPQIVWPWVLWSWEPTLAFIHNKVYPSPSQIQKVLRNMVTSCRSIFPIGTAFIAHCVCHGMQHNQKPLNSALLL